LAMSTMRFADEVVDVTDLEAVPSRRSKPKPDELKLATQIIDALATDWKPERYHDTFTEELRSRIEARDRGDEVVEEAEAEPSDDEGKVIDLMAALEASVAEAKSGRGGRARSSGSKGKRAKSSGSSTTRAASKRSSSSAKKHPSKKAASSRSRSTRKSA